MLMRMNEVCKRYQAGTPMVVENISLTIDRGETLAIFGESGSGKSTIGQIIAGIFAPSSGKLFFEEQKLRFPFSGEPRRRIQILFQHPEISFNPKMKLIDSLKEPYRFFGLPYTKQSLCEYLNEFGIYEEHLDRFPAELSGGELQRMALARLMLIEPSLIVLDEPTSMLDVISQAQVIHLLKEIQRQKEIGYLFVSHDYALCECFCDRILHLEDGRLTQHEDFNLGKKHAANI